MITAHETLTQNPSHRLPEPNYYDDERQLQIQGQFSSLTSRIRGQQLLIPSLDKVFQDWARRTNEGYERLKPVMIQNFERMMKNPKKLKKLARDDYALCGSGMYMNADFEGLRIMTLLTTWLFFFDDKVDHKDAELFDDASGFNRLTRQALDYAAYTMGLMDDWKEPEGGLDDFVSIFHDIGFALRNLSEGKLGIHDKRRFWLEDFEFYLRSLIQEQRESLDGKIRTFDGYMALRRGTVCMYTICSADEIASGVKIPSSDELPISELVQLWTEIRDLMIFVNDLYSFPNEMRSDNGASLVTLCLEKGSDLAEAVSEIYQLTIDAKTRFDRKAAEILARFPKEKHADLNRYFDSLKALVTGYHTWCNTTTRYSLASYVREDGSVLVTI